MKKGTDKEQATDALNMERKHSPIAIGDTVIQECPVCHKVLPFRIYTGYRAVCEACGYEIHLK